MFRKGEWNDWPGGHELQWTPGWMPSYNNPDNNGGDQPAEPEGYRLSLPDKEPINSGHTEGMDFKPDKEPVKDNNGDLPSEPATRAHKKCFEWLALCVKIGFADKSQLDKLEAIWWEHLDNNGKVKKSIPVKESEQEPFNKMVARLATERYPYLENPNNDLGVREHNQRMYDKREAFIDGYVLAS